MGGSRSRARGRHQSKQTARLVFAVVCLILLGVSFGLGVLAGRQWAQRSATALESSRQGGGPREAPNGGRGESLIARRGRSVASEPAYPQIQEKLTFYQTLPAPLGASPAGEKGPAERPVKRETRTEKATAARPESKPTESKPEGRPGPAPESPRPVSSAAPTAYTVQVAAYRSRAQAEALRQAIGEGAYVVEAAAESGVTYRVRLGAYSTRAEAEAAAARVRAERAVTAFITTR